MSGLRFREAALIAAFAVLYSAWSAAINRLDALHLGFWLREALGLAVATIPLACSAIAWRLLVGKGRW